MKTKADLLAFLDRIGVEAETHEHPAVFRVGEADDVASPKHGDAITLTGTSEVFRVEKGGHLRDEFKTKLAVTDVTGMPDDD